MSSSLAISRRHAYPVYFSLFLAPPVRMDFAQVQVLVFWILAAVTAASVPMWFAVIGRRRETITIVAAEIFLFGTPQFIHGLELQQPSLLVCALLALAAFLLVKGRFWLAGTVMALATVKPHLVLIPLVWLGLWGLFNWATREEFLISFIASVGILILVGEVLVPGWSPQFIHRMVEYEDYTGTMSLIEVVAGKWTAIVITPVCVLGLLWTRHFPSKSVQILRQVALGR